MTTDPPTDDAPAEVRPDVATFATPADAQNAAGNGVPPPAETAPAPPADEAPAEERPVAQEEPADEAPADQAAPAGEAAAEKPAEAAPSKKQWYVVKVQSGREETVKEAIERRVKIEGLEEFFGQVVVPMERETVTIQSGKRKGQKTVKKRKKFPGYIMAQVEFNDKILYLFRETSGVGDFVGGSLTKPPTPMSDREVAAMLRDQDDVKGGVPTVKDSKRKGAPVKLPFGVGDKVRVREGIFAGQEGEIKEVREPKDESESHRIFVEITVFGRPTRVQLEHWQIEAV